MGTKIRVQSELIMAFAEEGRRQGIPISLIKQVQISLREEAGVPSSYDPQDPSLFFDHLHSSSSSSSSLSEILEKFDPSVPSYLRCKQCRAPLLRGIQSIVCGFCGVLVKKDIPPDPIPFKSTYSYKWLLESLDLNGSEAVGLAVEDSGSSKGKDAPKDDLILSDLFDLELKWPTDQEKPDSVTNNKASFQSNSSLNLAGVDLDNYFTEATKEVTTGQESPNLFENTQAYNLAVGPSPSEGDGGESLSGWDAGFQSASSGTFPGDSKSRDSFMPNPDVKFQSRAADSDVTVKTDLFPSAPIGEPKGNSNDPSSTSSSWMEDDLWPSGTNKTPKIEKVNSTDDPFDPWQDFASSGNAQDFSMTQKQSSGEPASSDNQASDVQQMDLFSGVSRSDNVATDVNIHENSISNRLGVAGVQTGEDGNSANSADSNVVESLMSQMHDLSFMLDTNLSIPKTE
ncbi:hypothetical protein MKW94_000966 [Papaver nudicaule]|uniref:DUF7815 domain-containing protein n=1 Tax=Papaver nudicaule TaxID=74823 RepID=A0AA41S6B8_PAPNU|nr:hypothetical protein [Papaver nudicaule]